MANVSQDISDSVTNGSYHLGLAQLSIADAERRLDVDDTVGARLYRLAASASASAAAHAMHDITADATMEEFSERAADFRQTAVDHSRTWDSMHTRKLAAFRAATRRAARRAGVEVVEISIRTRPAFED